MSQLEATEVATDEPKLKLKEVIEEVLREFHVVQERKQEPVYRAELAEERRLREEMERQLKTLMEENRRAKELAERVETENFVKGELQKLGITKVDLAFRAIREDVQKDGAGRYTARTMNGSVALNDYLTKFVEENPELLPARNLAGNGSQNAGRRAASQPGFNLESIRPGMSQEDLAKVRNEIARVAGLLIE